MSKTRNFDNQFAFDLDETTPVIASSPDNRLALQHTDALLEQLGKPQCQHPRTGQAGDSTHAQWR